MHDEPLPQCKQLHDEFKEHQKESIPVRSSVDTLKEGMVRSMEDIRDIKDDLKDCKESVDSIDRKVDSKFNELKVWILTSAIAGLLVLLGEAIYFGGFIKQSEIDTKRIDKLEAVLLPVHKVFPTSAILGD